MPEINKALLRAHILKSSTLTALEKRYLERLVAADSSNKVGHWIRHTDATAMTLFECSCCKGWYPIAGKTCPCGAVMDGGDDHVE